MSKLEELIAELCPDGVEYKSWAKLRRTYIGVLESSGNKLHQQELHVFVMGKSTPHMGYGLMNAFHIPMPLQSPVLNILSMEIFYLSLLGKAL